MGCETQRFGDMQVFNAVSDFHCHAKVDGLTLKVRYVEVSTVIRYFDIEEGLI